MYTDKYKIEQEIGFIYTVLRKIEYCGMVEPANDISEACDNIMKFVSNMDKKRNDMMDESLKSGRETMGLLLGLAMKMDDDAKR